MSKKKWLAISLSAIFIVSCIMGFLLIDFSSQDLNNESSNSPSVVSGESVIDEEIKDKEDDESVRYNVTFYSNDGTVLKIDSVKENSSAMPPNIPAVKYGTVFKSWDTDFSDVTKDLNIYPICEETKGKPNVLAIQSRYTKKGDTVVVPIQLCGEVCVSGLDITIRYDDKMLHLKNVTEDKGVVFNDATPGIIKLNYVSTENTDADVDICDLQFFVSGAEGKTPITIEINGIYAFNDEDTSDELYIPKSTIINGEIFVVN